MRLTTKVRGSLLFTLISLSTLLSPAVSMAIPVLGGQLFVQNDGNVTATFLGHTAKITSDLYLDSPANNLGMIFTNQSTPVGTTFDLGFFTSGTELVFRLLAHESKFGIGPPQEYYTGAASRNPDGLAHAIVDDEYEPFTTYVGFEDVFGGGDLDYDDLRFSFTNTTTETLPEPATSLLLGTGLGGLALIRRFKKVKRGVAAF